MTVSQDPSGPTPGLEPSRLLDELDLPLTIRTELPDRLAGLAVTLLDVPGAVVNLVHGDAHHVMGVAGPLGERIPRQVELGPTASQMVVGGNAELIVPDYGAHPVLRASPARRRLGIEAFAGVPVRGAEGNVLGTLAAVDSAARAWSERDLDVLRQLAALLGPELERLRVTRTLESAEAHYRRLVRTSPHAVYALDRRGRFIELNEAGVALAGRAVEDVLGTHFIDLIAPEGRTLATEAFERVLAGERDRLIVELPLMRPTGERRLARITAVTMLDGGTVIGSHGIAEDITEARRLEADRERLLSILEQSPDFIGIRTARHEPVWANARARELLGRIAHLPGSGPFGLQPEWVAEMLRAVALPAAARDGAWTGESALLRPNGTEMPVSQLILAHRGGDDGVEFYSTVMRDISDVKAKERALRESETLYRGLVEQSLAGIYRVEDGRITYANPRFAEIFGRTVAEIVAGCTFQDLIHAEERDEVIGRARAQIDRDGTARSRFRAVRPDGGGIVVESQASRCTVDGRTVFVGVVLDITERQRAEDELLRSRARLLESERFLQSVFDALNAHIAVLDERGRILAVNAAWVRFAEANGGGEGAGVGADYLAVCDRAADSVSAHAAADGLRAVLRGDVPEFALEYPCHSPDAERWFVLRATRAATPAGRRVVVSHEDVTARVQAEAAIRASEGEYRQRFEANPAVQLVIDPTSTVILDANTAACSFYGYPKRVLVGMRIRDLNTGPEEAVRARMAELMATGTHSFVVRHRIAGGDVRDIEVFASMAEGEGAPRLHAIVHDVTDRARAEAALRDSERRFRSLFEHNPVAIYLLDTNGRIVDVNPACERLTGFARSELRGRNAVELVVPEDVIAVEAAFRRAAEGEPQRHEYGFTTRSGARSEARVTAVPVLVEGRVYGVFGVAEDVGEQKRLEAQLRQALKMEAVGRLAGGVAHDFNNLLTVISGHAEMALDAMGTVDPLREDIQEIQRSTDRAASLTRQLLAFSRKQVLNTRPLNLNVVVGDMERMLHRVVGEDIAFAYELEPELWTTVADRGQLEQVLLNLVINARDAMPHGGRLTITTGNVHVNGNAARLPVAVLPGAYVALRVADTGVGMDAVTLSQIFEPFFTTKEVGRGTGLGLSTIYGIVRQLDGYVWAESEPGRGALFTVLLPRSTDPAASDEAAEETAPAGRARTILLVEDEASVRSLVKRVLERRGHHVLDAADPAEALRLAEECARPIHLLVTDVVMPGMNGPQLARRIRQRIPGIAILYMSGYIEEAARREGLFEAGSVLLQKPFSTAVLVRTVEALWNDGGPPA